MLSRMSSKRCSGSLEGTHYLCLNPLLDSRLEAAFFGQVNLHPKQIGDTKLKTNHVKNRQSARGIKDCKQINIRIGSLVTSRGGAEQCQTFDPGVPQLLFMRSQRRQHLFARHAPFLPVRPRRIKSILYCSSGITRFPRPNTPPSPHHVIVEACEADIYWVAFRLNGAAPPWCR